jgi:hypothetical protein
MEKLLRSIISVAYSIMSVLSLKHIFGFKGDVKDCIQYIDETNVLYPAGNILISYNTEKKVQKFININSNQAQTPSLIQQANNANNNNSNTNASNTSSSDGLLSNSTAASSGALNNVNFVLNDNITTSTITALAISPLTKQSQKNRIFAVAERSETGRASVSIYDCTTFKRKLKNSLQWSELQSGEFICLCFSPDGKYLLTQGGAPDYTLINWQLDKSKPLQIARVTNSQGSAIHQISFCPTDPSVVCVSGAGILRFLHLEANEFKSIPFSLGKRESQNYLCHCWLDDRIVVATDTGDLLIFENAEFRGVLESSPSDGKSIDCLVAYSKGFICGCDEGIIYLFERDDREIYKQTKSFQIDNNYVKIKAIAISPSEDNIICTLENNQSYVLGLSNTDILKQDEMNFEPLALPTHHLTISGLDLCLRKPLCVTTGLDRSVRVWNYVQKSVEAMKFFNEQPISVAFHPSGLFIIVGFTDSIKLINLLMDELREFKEFPIKNAREIQFSNGGQYFAVASANNILVFASWSHQQIANFAQNKGKIKSLYWLHDDSAIVSAANDGFIYQTSLKTGNSLIIAQPSGTKGGKSGSSGGNNAGNSANLSGAAFSCVVQGADGRTYAASNENSLKIFTENALSLDISMNSNFAQLAMCLSKPPLKDRYLFAGSERGIIRQFSFPIENHSKTYDFQVCSGAVTKMRVSSDEQWLFVVSEDSTLSVLQIDGKRNELNSNNSAQNLASPQGKSLLSSGGGGEHSASNLSRSRQDHLLPFAEEILVSQSDLQEKLSILADLQLRVTELTKQNAYELQLREQNYRERLREVTERFHSQLETDKEKYSTLEEAKESLEKQFTARVEQLNQLQRDKRFELQHHQQNKLKQEQERLKDLQRKQETQREQHEAKLSQLKAQFDGEKHDLLSNSEHNLASKHGEKLRQLKEKGAVLREFEETKQLMEADADEEIEELKGNYDKKLSAERIVTLRLKDQNAILKRKFTSLREDIAENLDELAAQREHQSQLYELIDQYEKDIRTHIKEIKERESTIGDKLHRIFELRKKNQELEKFRFVLDYKIAELKRQIQPRKLEMKSLQLQLQQMDNELRQYKSENNNLILQYKEYQDKFNAMEKEEKSLLGSKDQLLTQFKLFKTELHTIFLNIEEPAQLKEGLKNMFEKYSAVNLETIKQLHRPGGAAESSGEEALGLQSDIDRDYNRQRNYLEKNVDSLNAKLTKDLTVHKKDNLRIMSENIQLTKEINELRREIHNLKLQQKHKGSGSGNASNNAATAVEKSVNRGNHRSNSVTGSSLHPSIQLMQQQQEQIRALNNQLYVLEDELAQVTNPSTAADRPLSASFRLPELVQSNDINDNNKSFTLVEEA